MNPAEQDAFWYDRMAMGRRGTEPFATLQVGPAKPYVTVVPERLKTIEPLAASDATPTRTVKLSIGFSLRRGMDLVVNGEMHHQDQPVKAHPLDARRPPRQLDDHRHILEHREAGMMGHFDVVR